MLRRRRSARRSPVSPRLILPAFGCSGGTSFAGSSWHRRWARGGSARGRTRQGVRVAVVPREGAKIHDVIKMLSRDGGATIDCCDGLAIAYHPRGAHWPSQTWVSNDRGAETAGPPPRFARRSCADRPSASKKPSRSGSCPGCRAAGRLTRRLRRSRRLILMTFEQRTFWRTRISRPRRSAVR